MQKQVHNALYEIPANELWLYEMLDQIRNPPFGTLFWITAKVYISAMIIALVIGIAMLLVGILFSLLTGGALLLFITRLLNPSYNFLVPFV